MIKESVSTIKTYKILLFNDNINCFDVVTAALMDCCGHTAEQAEQCTILAHCKGHAVVLTSSDFFEVHIANLELSERGITCKMEVYGL